MPVQPELSDAITRELLTRGGRREGDEIRFCCLVPEHHQHGDADPSARWNERKGVWCCDVSGLGGSAVDIAKRLGITIARVRGSGTGARNVRGAA